MQDYPASVLSQFPRHPNYEKLGKVCENGVLQIMNQHLFVEGIPAMAGITLFDVYCYLHKAENRHFPSADDIFHCNGKKYYLSKLWKRVLDGGGNVTGYKEVKMNSGYQRPTKIMYSFKVDANGKLCILKKFDFTFRIHIMEKFMMIHRVMIKGVPRDYVLDPYEKLWYLVLKHGKYERRTSTKKPKGVTIKIGNQTIALEVSRLDHGGMGLNFLRIETKDMNISRTIKCFANIKCVKCDFEIPGDCKHTPLCRNTYEMLCDKCAMTMSEE